MAKSFKTPGQKIREYIEQNEIFTGNDWQPFFDQIDTEFRTSIISAAKYGSGDPDKYYFMNYIDND
jgi:hypothetical protein